MFQASGSRDASLDQVRLFAIVYGCLRFVERRTGFKQCVITYHYHPFRDRYESYTPYRTLPPADQKLHGDRVVESLAKILGHRAFNSGLVGVDVSGCFLDPAAITVLAASLSKVGLARVDLSGNGLSGETFDRYGRSSGVDSDLAGITTFCEALPSSKITELLISKCGLGPKSIAIVAASLATAGVTRVDFSGNNLTGGEMGWNAEGSVKDVFKVGKDVIGLQQLTKALPTSKIVELIISNCGIGPDAVSILAASLATAGLAEVDISGNFPMGRISRDNDGQGPWLPGKDMSGWRELCTSLAGSKVKSVKAANCELGPEPISALAATLATAGVVAVDLRNNRFDPSLLDGIKHKIKLNLDGCRP